MRFARIPVLLLSVVIAVAVMVVSLGVLGTASPVLAQERGLAGPVRLAPSAQQPPPADDFVFGVVLTDPAAVEIQDLSGNIIGQGEHEGEVRCNDDNCSQKIMLDFTIPLTTPPFSYEYKFKSRQAIDPQAERVVVAGTGTISSERQKERFTFTATFENNRDGTVWVSYVASRPDASFIIPKTPGTFRIFSRR